MNDVEDKQFGSSAYRPHSRVPHYLIWFKSSGRDERLSPKCGTIYILLYMCDWCDGLCCRDKTWRCIVKVDEICDDWFKSCHGPPRVVPHFGGPNSTWHAPSMSSGTHTQKHPFITLTLQFKIQNTLSPPLHKKIHTPTNLVGR